MSRLEDIDANLLVVDELFQMIKKEYDSSLSQRKISKKLPVYIKNYMENLRSPLDYLGKEISERTLSQKKSKKAPFPMAYNNKKEFIHHMNVNFPNLQGIDPSLYNKLESFQSYNPNGCRPLRTLSTLVNENKHSKLSAQTRKEKRSLNIKFPSGASISMGPGSSISGTGTISSGNAWINPGGGTISGEQPARIGNGVKQEVTVWVSCYFEETQDNVIDLLTDCRNDVERIIKELIPIIWPGMSFSNLDYSKR